MGHPTCIIEGLACWLTLCILEKIICNSTISVQISFIETLKLIVFSWTIWWCYWQNVLMINEENNFLTVSWLSGLLSAEIFISTGEWGVQMPPLTSENSYFLRSGPQGATLVMKRLSKQSRRRWFETPSRSLWRHCNGMDGRMAVTFPGDVQCPQMHIYIYMYIYQPEICDIIQSCHARCALLVGWIYIFCWYKPHQGACRAHIYGYVQYTVRNGYN